VGAQIHGRRYLCGVLGGYDVVTQNPTFVFLHSLSGGKGEKIMKEKRKKIK
jgi:hypothetical protein